MISCLVYHASSTLPVDQSNLEAERVTSRTGMGSDSRWFA